MAHNGLVGEREKSDALDSQRKIARLDDARREFRKTVLWRKAAH